MTKKNDAIAKARTTVAALALIAGGWSAMAFAADDAAPDASAEERGSEILVTARRRDESAQEVPIALSVLGGEALESKGAYHLQQLYQEVPSLTVFTLNPRNVNINIRGLGSNVGWSDNSLDQGVGFYVDDVYYARVGQAGFDLVDVDHIEILRGPQGTLFGRNTTAGAISVTTRPPSFAPEARGDISVGNYGFVQGRGTISGAIVGDKLAGRLSFEATTRDGFVKDVHTQQRVHDFNNFTVRGSLLWKIGDDASLQLTADYARQKQECCVAFFRGVATQYDDGTPLAETFYDMAARLNYTPLPFDPKARKTDVNELRALRMDQGGVSARLKWDLGGAELTSISAFRWWNWTPHSDFDYTSLDVLVEGNNYDRQRQWSQEIRLASTGNRTIDYVAGLYFFHQSIRGWSILEYGRDAGNLYMPDGTYGLTHDQLAATLDGAVNRTRYDPRTTSFAGFGQATWHLSPALSLTAGARLTRERKYGYFEQTRENRADISGLNETQLALRDAYTPLVPYYSLSRWWTSFSGMATLSAQLSPDALAYATYSHGAKSGGLNFTDLPRDDAGNVRNDLAVVKPEKVDNFELGLKTQWFGKRLTANIALFLVNVKNYQSTVFDTATIPGQNYFYVANFAKVRSKGVELDLQARPTDNVSLYASGTYNDAEYVSYPGAQCPWEQRAPGQPTVCDLSGERLPGSPRWAFSAGGEVSQPIGGGGNVAYAGVDYSYRSSYYSSYNLSRYSKVDGFGLVNARLGVRGPDDKWDLSVWGRNIFNKLYFYNSGINAVTGGGGEITGQVGDPRTYGVTFRRQF
ncbi:MAG: TonB-dependent receptor [Sphingobium sp.]